MKAMAVKKGQVGIKVEKSADENKPKDSCCMDSSLPNCCAGDGNCACD